MAKVSGLGMAIAVDDSGGTARTISTDITNCTLSTPRGTADITGVDSSAREQLLLLADFTITLNGVMDTGSNLAHDVFKTVASTSVTRTVTLTQNSKVLPNETIFTDYAITRAADGSLTWSAPGILNSTTVPTWA